MKIKVTVNNRPENDCYNRGIDVAVDAIVANLDDKLRYFKSKALLSEFGEGCKETLEQIREQVLKLKETP